MDDILNLNPDTLDSVADIVEAYCKKQISIMDDYLRNTSSLSSGWSDDQTIGQLLKEIRNLKRQVESISGEIQSTYPAYFRNKAEQIRRRPRI